MLRNHMRLPGSLDYNHRSSTCAKCGHTKSISDGVEAGGKFVCGTCWRKKGSLTRKFGAKK